jgi:hypothetical protein
MRKEWIREVCASGRMIYGLLRKNLIRIYVADGTFLLFCGNNNTREVRLLTARDSSGHTRAGRIVGAVFYF